MSATTCVALCRAAKARSGRVRDALARRVERENIEGGHMHCGAEFTLFDRDAHNGAHRLGHYELAADGAL
jgi:hypothetical protein